MGMPLYGQAFSLTNENKNGLNALAPLPGQAGEFTRAAGFLAYYEVSTLSPRAEEADGMSPHLN